MNIHLRVVAAAAIDVADGLLVALVDGNRSDRDVFAGILDRLLGSDWHLWIGSFGRNSNWRSVELFDDVIDAVVELFT